MSEEILPKKLDILKLLYAPKVFFEQLYLVLKSETAENKKKNIFKMIILPSLILVAIISILGLFTVDKLAHVADLKEYYASLNMEVPDESILMKSYYATIFGNGFAQLGMLVVKAGMVAGIAVLASGAGSVRDAFTITIYAFIPVLIGKILSVLFFGDLMQSFNLGLILSLEEGSLGYYLIQEIDVFVIWYQMLMVYGISYTFDIDIKRAVFAVLVPWIMFVMVRAGFQNLNFTVGTDVMI